MDLIKLLAPFAPFLAEELWHEFNMLGEFKNSESVHKQSWPKFDPLLAEIKITSIPVQINGKLRGQVDVDAKDTEETIKAKVMQLPNAKQYLEGKEIKKFIYIAGKIVNVVN
jgi:leucyl-tRNA synthetase